MDKEVRKKAYAATFLVSGLAIAAVGLSNIWYPDLISSTSLQIVLTLVLVAALSATLYMLTLNNCEELLSQKMSYVIGVCSVLITILLIGEIWFDFLENSMLGKLLVSLFIVAGVAGFVMAVWDDFFENKKLKDEGYLD